MKTNQNNEKTVPTQEQIEAACRQSARHFWNWLTWSLVYYVVINLFLIAINWFTSPHYWWVLWVIAGWGISLLMTAIEKSITTLFVSLLIWFLVVTTRNYYWQYLWFLLPIIAGTGTYLSTRNQQPGIKTHLDKVINYIWLVFGITGFLISMLAMFFWQLPILFIILLLMGMGTTLTGLVVGYKTVTICGTLGALSSIGCLFYPGPNQILIFAPVFIFMMVIPGHVLNHAARKQKKS